MSLLGCVLCQGTQAHRGKVKKLRNCTTVRSCAFSWSFLALIFGARKGPQALDFGIFCNWWCLCLPTPVCCSMFQLPWSFEGGPFESEGRRAVWENLWTDATQRMESWPAERLWFAMHSCPFKCGIHVVESKPRFTFAKQNFCGQRRRVCSALLGDRRTEREGERETEKHS